MKKIGITLVLIIILIGVIGIICAKESENDLKVVSVDNQKVDIINSEKGINPVIKIIEITRSKSAIDISYEFDNSKYIGESITIDIVIVDVNSSEVSKISDSFPINRDPPIKRKVALNFSKDSIGIYNIILGVNNEPESILKVSFEAIKPAEDVKNTVKKNTSRLTGQTILENSGPKMIGYGIFIAIILAVLFVMMKDHDKEIDKKGHDFIIPSGNDKDNNLPETPVKAVAAIAS